MLSRSGDDFTIPHDPDPLGDDVLTIVGGYLDIYPSSISLILGWHLRVSIAISEVVYLGLMGVYCPGELVDVPSSFDEALVSEGSVALHHRDEAVCNGAHGVSEVVVLHVEDGLSQARGYWGVVSDAVGGDAYSEWGRGCDLLDRWSGGVRDILDQ